ncbi:hypothetical protein [Nesterenkonia jeotgali]|uniref:ATP synthase F0 subunit B n=1 Tax=Nesterenkonia jeotgali TaxID=317018 RepID=A0A0W8IKW9_9MICC|nr:hypothetical protein [Nesterenkonia jeotgali]KUG60304.1 hypothetical protein AVL63_07790 [Nesterenkonia jeotgali]
MTESHATPPRSEPHDEDPQGTSPTDASPASASEITAPVPVVDTAPPGLESVTGEPGYSARHASDVQPPGTTERSRAEQPRTGPPSAGQPGDRNGATGDSRAPQAQEAARDVAGDAKGAGRAVRDAAAEEAAGVKDDAVREAKRLGGQASTVLESQASEQLDRAAGTVRSFSDDVGRIARGEEPEEGAAKDLLNQLDSRAEAAATWLEQHDPREVLQELQSFARRRPVAFLAIAAGVGFAAGRLTRGIAQNHAEDAGPHSAASRDGSQDTPRDHTGYGSGPRTESTTGAIPDIVREDAVREDQSGAPVPGDPIYHANSAGPTSGDARVTDPYLGGGR